MSKNLLEEYRREYESASMDEEAYRVMRKRMEEGKKDRIKMKNIQFYSKWGVAVAAAFAILVLPNTSATAAYAMGKLPILGNLFQVVTVRDYQYEDKHQKAEVDVPKITADKEAASGVEEAQKSANEVNEEIEKITEQYVRSFKKKLKKEGYQNIVVKSEQVNMSEDYFTLKLMCYESAADGAETDYYYTINTATGKKMRLSDFFQKDSDYQTVISDNIKTQMRKQMAAEDNISYWLDEDDEDMNFTKIDSNQAFYVNENNEIVCCFQEGDVAPMYMGNVEFTIPKEAVAAIRK
jgi:molybdopterin converting factor small subunit